MVWNIIRISLRNIRSHKFYYFINITGLVLGFLSSILILLYVFNEMSYDKFHVNASRIYRICARGVIGNTKINQVFTSAPVPRALLNDFPEVENVVRIMDMSNVEIRYQETSYIENDLIAVDSNFFEIFTFPLVQGNPHKALEGPNRVLISESAALRYFGSEDPMGKNIRVNDDLDFEISGVFKNVPPNSHFHFHFIGSLTTMEASRSENWMNNNFKTYLLLKEGTDAAGLEAKFPGFVKKYIFPDEKEAGDFMNSGNSWEYFLQPLTDIHLTSDLDGEFEPNGNRFYVYVFLFTALFIITIAAVNFTNLSTAKSERRAREVGIRKVIGSSRGLLIRQFLIESLILSFIALVIALLLSQMLLTGFNQLSGKSFDMGHFLNPFLLFIMLSVTILVGLLAGIYPGIYLSSFNPSLVLKTGQSGQRSGTLFRGILVVFQFFISVSLIIATLVVYRQLQFFQKTSLGFNKEKIVLVHGTDKLGNDFSAFRDRLMTFHEIKNVSGSNTVPGQGFNNWGMKPEGENAEWLTLNAYLCDTAFMNTFELTMAEGRFFSPAFPSDSGAIIINKNAAELLGWEEAVGKKIKLWGEFPFEVIGVINDFHYESLHQTIRPMGIFMMPFLYERYPGIASIKITGENPEQTVAFIEEQWKQMKTGLPFNYSFFEEDYGKLYENETKTSNVLLVFSILAIFISSLGLLALSAYMIEKRTREIGIRKVNGATSGNIILLLTADFTRYIIIAIILAVPMAYYGMEKWLENFPYRTNIPWWIFVIAGCGAVLIAWMAVGFQTIRASIQNPADTLRYE